MHSRAKIHSDISLESTANVDISTLALTRSIGVAVDINETGVVIIFLQFIYGLYVKFEQDLSGTREITSVQVWAAQSHDFTTCIAQ